MIPSVLHLGGAALAGAMIGALYLGLLWVSVGALAGSRPAAAFVALAAARAALVLASLATAFAAGAGADEILAALAGFVGIRLAATRRMRTGDGRPTWK